MIKIENVETYGWEAAIRGMRNPMNSWEHRDSYHTYGLQDDPYIEIPEHDYPRFYIGPNDQQLMRSLAKAGPVHAKFRRMLTITMDITAPLYWWKEFDTYKVGTVANSCSTMHKIHAKEFELDDFSYEHLIFDKNVPDDEYEMPCDWNAVNDKYCGLDDTDFINFNSFPGEALKYTIAFLNRARSLFLETKDKKYWWQMIQLLPSSYNQKRTVLLNYEVASHIYPDRKNHKLDEWHVFCEVLENLPFSELITGEITNNPA